MHSCSAAEAPEAATSAALPDTPAQPTDTPAACRDASSRDESAGSEGYVIVSPPAGDSAHGPTAAPLVTQAAARRAEELREEGKTCFNAGDVEGALHKWQSAADLDPADVRIHNNLALAWLRHGDAIRALGCAEAAVRLAATCNAKSAAKAFLRRSEAHKACGNSVNSARDFDEWRRLDAAAAGEAAAPVAAPSASAAPAATGIAAPPAVPPPTSAASPSRESSYVHVHAPDSRDPPRSDSGRLAMLGPVPLADVDQTLDVAADGSETITYHVLRKGRIPLRKGTEVTPHDAAPAGLEVGMVGTAQDSAISSDGKAQTDVISDNTQDGAMVCSAA